MGTVLSWRRYTLWVGIRANQATDLSPSGVLAIEQLRRGESLQCDNGLRLECIRSNEEILGYGIVLRRGSTPKLVGFNTDVGIDQETLIEIGRAALEQWFLPAKQLIIGQDLADV